MNRQHVSNKNCPYISQLCKQTAIWSNFSSVQTERLHAVVCICPKLRWAVKVIHVVGQFGRKQILKV